MDAQSVAPFAGMPALRYVSSRVMKIWVVRYPDGGFARGYHLPGYAPQIWKATWDVGPFGFWMRSDAEALAKSAGDGVSVVEWAPGMWSAPPELQVHVSTAVSLSDLRALLNQLANDEWPLTEMYWDG